MAESRRVYRWELRWDDPLATVAAQPAVVRALEIAAIRYRGFMGAEIEHEDHCLIVKLTMKGRDQWWVHRKQWNVMAGVSATLRSSLSSLPEPVISQLPHHRLRTSSAKRQHGAG